MLAFIERDIKVTQNEENTKSIFVFPKNGIFEEIRQMFG